MIVRKSSGVGFRLGFSATGIRSGDYISDVTAKKDERREIVRPADPETAEPGRPTAPHVRNLRPLFRQSAIWAKRVEVHIQPQDVYPGIAADTQQRIIRRFGNFAADHFFT